jgi:uncharacterized membrane protein
VPHKCSILAQSLFYLTAGVNHFINPGFYIQIILDYLPEKEAIKTLAGIVEILASIGLLSEKLRTNTALSIILMLLVFIPSHIYFIEIGSCVDQGLCVSPIISWVTFALIHPLLIWWAITAYNTSAPHYGGNKSLHFRLLAEFHNLDLHVITKYLMNRSIEVGT